MRLAFMPPSVLLAVVMTALRVVQILNVLRYRAAWFFTLERVIFAPLLYYLLKRLASSFYFTLLRKQIHFLYQDYVYFCPYLSLSIYELDPFSRNLVWTLFQPRPLRRHAFLFNTAGKSNTADYSTCKTGGSRILYAHASSKSMKALFR
jgi:hypothetical protein